jgi:hypothetical protein
MIDRLLYIIGALIFYASALPKAYTLIATSRRFNRKIRTRRVLDELLNREAAELRSALQRQQRLRS